MPSVPVQKRRANWPKLGSGPSFLGGQVQIGPLNDPLFRLCARAIFGNPCFTAAKRASERLTSGSTAGFWGVSEILSVAGPRARHPDTKSQGILLRPDLGKIALLLLGFVQKCRANWTKPRSGPSFLGVRFGFSRSNDPFLLIDAGSAPRFGAPRARDYVQEPVSRDAGSRLFARGSRSAPRADANSPPNSGDFRRDPLDLKGQIPS